MQLLLKHYSIFSIFLQSMDLKDKHSIKKCNTLTRQHFYSCRIALNLAVNETGETNTAVNETGETKTSYQSQFLNLKTSI
jgi:hypothetical protein